MNELLAGIDAPEQTMQPTTMFGDVNLPARRVGWAAINPIKPPQILGIRPAGRYEPSCHVVLIAYGCTGGRDPSRIRRAIKVRWEIEAQRAFTRIDAVDLF